MEREIKDFISFLVSINWYILVKAAIFFVVLKNIPIV